MSGSSTRGSCKVAFRFGRPVNDHDAEMTSLRVGAIPNNTKATHWNEWAASGATTKDKYSYCFVVHTLSMHLLSKKVHYLFIAHLSEL